MTKDDFGFMWQGKITQVATSEDMALLAPVHRHRDKKHRALLLLHGFSSSPAVYRKLIPQLSFYDALVCPLLPGHGTNIEDFSKVRAQEWLHSADAACKALVEQYTLVDVMGLSLGGVLATYVSYRYKLNHLYLLAPAFSLTIHSKLALITAQILHRLGIKHLKNRAGNLQNSEFNELVYKRLPLTTIVEILHLIHHFSYEPFQCPVDLFLGTSDKVVNSQAIAKRFENEPQVQIHWLLNSAHVLPLEKDTDCIVNVVRNNIEEEP